MEVIISFSPIIRTMMSFWNAKIVIQILLTEDFQRGWVYLYQRFSDVYQKTQQESKQHSNILMILTHFNLMKTSGTMTS